MSGYCDWCDEEFFDNDDSEYYKDLCLCSKCYEWFQENDGRTGRLVVIKCSECGHVKKSEFVRYKEKGRPMGSKNLKLKNNQTKLDINMG